VSPPSLKLYTVFHLNLAYSSIEEEQRSDVIKRCYWPLLRLARKYNLPCGIEAPGYTLETINEIDPDWIEELRRLVTEGHCEFIGSGYAQIIGPLVPAEVNAANMRIGNNVYVRLLGIRPQIALLNEQAFSVGLIRHYIDAGYRAIIMEWDNPYRTHPEWHPEWRYLPQIARGQHGEEIPIIWNNSIAFQKFQRYAHGDMDLDAYLSYLNSHCSNKPRFFSLYGNDVEVFDFRPNRYETEAPLELGEWERIETLLKVLLDKSEFTFIRPSHAFNFLNQLNAANRICLESSDQPIPVKKQGKYNVTRWAVTGRNDLMINTACWRIYEALKNAAAADGFWKELCYLWSSDFRTHITDKRWNAYLQRLSEFEEKIGTAGLLQSLARKKVDADDKSQTEIPSHVIVSQDKSYLTVETAVIKIRLNLRRGLAIDALWFKDISREWLCGTLHHGYYDDINWGADYYTGHIVLESPGYRRITDLEPVKNFSIDYEKTTDAVKIKAEFLLECGKLFKTYRIHSDNNRPRVDIVYELEWSRAMLGSLRLGYITLNPSAFSQTSLFYETHNGGHDIEHFPIEGSIYHGDAVSFLISARHALGCTGGMVKLGDDKTQIHVSIDKTVAALVGMIQYQEPGNSYFLRFCWSARELDETARTGGTAAGPWRCSMSVSASQPEYIDRN